MCDSRYNDRERIFVKIKNWNSCVPEEVRKSADFMPINPFEAPVFPMWFPSPFLAGGRGTGGLGDSVEKAEGDKHEGGGIGRKRPWKAASGTTTVNQTGSARLNRVVYVGPPTPATTSLLGVPLTATTSTGTGSTAVYQPSIAGQPQRTVSSQGGKPNEDRSMLGAVGGLSVVGSQNLILEKLSPETGGSPLLPFVKDSTLRRFDGSAKHFDRDPETNEVLWFASPPVDVAPSVRKPRHSFAYLNHLAKKWKLELEKEKNRGESGDPGMDVDDDAWQKAMADFS